jgi:hypothetical protein
VAAVDRAEAAIGITEEHKVVFGHSQAALAGDRFPLSPIPGNRTTNGISVGQVHDLHQLSPRHGLRDNPGGSSSGWVETTRIFACSGVAEQSRKIREAKTNRNIAYLFKTFLLFCLAG